MKYSHIFFDWHGVLSKSVFWSHTPEYPIIETALFGRLQPLLRSWLEGSCDVANFVAALAAETNLTHQYLMQTLEQSCHALEFSSPKIPAMISALRNQGIVCVISTDNFDVFDRWVVPALGLDAMFDAILNSYTIKHVKPEIDDNGLSPFFSPYLATHQVGKALLVDDNDYSHVAQQLGFDFIQIGPDNDLVEVVESVLLSDGPLHLKP